MLWLGVSNGSLEAYGELVCKHGSSQSLFLHIAVPSTFVALAAPFQPRNICFLLHLCRAPLELLVWGFTSRDKFWPLKIRYVAPAGYQVVFMPMLHLLSPCCLFWTRPFEIKSSKLFSMLHYSTVAAVQLHVTVLAVFKLLLHVAQCSKISFPSKKLLSTHCIFPLTTSKKYCCSSSVW